MAAHVGGIDVRDGNVEARAWCADFFRGRDDRFCAAENFAHGIATRDVPQGSMLEFAGSTDDRSLAVAFDDLSVSTQCGDQGARHFEAEGLEVVHEAGDLLHVGTGERIMDNRERGGAAQWDWRGRAALMENFFHRRQLFSNLHFRHEQGSYRGLAPFLSESLSTSRPPVSFR